MSFLALGSVWLALQPSPPPLSRWEAARGKSPSAVSQLLGSGKALEEGARSYRLQGAEVHVEWYAGRAESFVFHFARKPKTWKEALARIGVAATGGNAEHGERNSFGDRCAYVSGLKGLPKGWIAVFAEGKANGWLAVQSPNFAAGW